MNVMNTETTMIHPFTFVFDAEEMTGEKGHFLVKEYEVFAIDIESQTQYK